MNGLIDGVNLTHLKENTWSKSQEQILNGNYQINNNLSVIENLTISGDLNGTPINRFMTTNTEQMITGEKTFMSDLHFNDSISLDNFTMNGYTIPDDFVSRDGDQTINGNKIFKNITAEQGINIQGLIDDVNVTSFDANKMTQTTDQTITSGIVFNSGINVNSDLSTAGLIDGINLTAFQNDIMNLGKKQVISGG